MGRGRGWWGAALAAAMVMSASRAGAAETQQAAPAAAVPAAAAPAADGSPVARVNGVAVTRAEFDRNLEFMLQSVADGAEGAEGVEGGGEPAAAAPAPAELRAQVLDRLIDEELLHQEARRRELGAAPAAVEEEIAQARSQFPTPEAFTEVLAKSRLTEEGLRALVSRNLSIQNLVEKGVAAGIAVTDAEVHEFYTANAESFAIPEQARARHILVQVGEEDDEAAKTAKRAKAEGLHAQLAAGANFEELARTSSDCPSAAEGGDLGFFERGQMPEAFDAAVFALAPGAVSGVIETEYGFHIVRLEERKPAGAVPEQEAAPQIVEFLRGQKTEAAVEALLKQLRATAKIEKTP